MSKAKKTGAPEKYRRDFHCEDFMMQSKKGKQVVQIATSWGVHRDTLYEWQKKHKEFSDSFKKGRQFCESFWMDIGHAAIFSKKVKLHDGSESKIDLGFYCYWTKVHCKWRETSSFNEDDDISEIEIKVTKHIAKKDNA